MKLLVQTYSDETVINKILANYNVVVRTNEFEYQDMVFEDDTNFRDTFCKVMEILRRKEQYITVYSVQAQLFDTESIYDAAPYKNWVHVGRDWNTLDLVRS